MMRERDLILFVIILLVAFVAGIFLIDKTCINYSDIITFLSIIIGFEITSLSILFNSPLKKKLFDNKLPRYKTELHRLAYYYKQSFVFGIISIMFIFLFPENLKLDICIKYMSIILGKQSAIYPILAGVVYCFYKICKDLFRIFTFPTND